MTLAHTAGRETRRDDWHHVAQDKLTRVLGANAGPATMREVLLEIGTARLESAEDLRRFASALSRRGGFAGAIAGLLSVHAAMYGAHAEARSAG
jgi:hypothetical protein